MRHILMIAFALSVLGIQSAEAINARTQEAAIADIAKAAVKFMKHEGIRTIGFQFQGRADLPSGGRYGIQERLREAIAPEGLEIVMGSKYTISARAVRSKQVQDSLATAIRCEIIDEYGDTVGSLATNVDVTDGSDVAELNGLTTLFKPSTDGLKRLNELSTERRKKSVYINDDGWVFSDQSGKFGMRVRASGQSTSVFGGSGTEKGLAFMRLPMNTAYTIELYNRADYEVAADVRVDGLNVFHFCDPGARKPDGGPRHWIVKPHGSLIVQGWFKSPSFFERFETSRIKDGAAANAGISMENIGMITATFHASWPFSGAPPRDEPGYENWIQPTPTYSGSRPGENIAGSTPPGSNLQGSAGPGSVDDISTRRGQLSGQKATVLNRETGVPRGTISLRYKRAF